MLVTTADCLYRLETPALHCIDVTECGMDRTLLKFAHFGLSLADHQMTVSCNKVIKSFNNRQLLTSDTPQQRIIHNFYKLNAPLKFPQTLAQNELFVNCSFNHSLDWTLTEFTHSYTPFDNTWVVLQHEHK